MGSSAVKITAHKILPIHIAGPMARDAFGLCLWDDAGHVGLGEAAPIQNFSPENLNQVEHALSTVGTRLHEVEETPRWDDSVQATLAPFGPILSTAKTAQFAFETALFDLLGQRQGCDVASLLRGDSPPCGSVETSALLRGAGDPTFVKRCRIAMARGFRALKVKLRAHDDATLQKELDGLLRLREVAPDVELRLDPNGRWSLSEARRFLSMLAAVRPAYVEQPVVAEDLLELGPCDVPWAADEALLVPGLAERLARDAGCAVWVIKPAAVGLLGAQRLAQMAFLKEFQVTVTHFFDGPVGLAAACEVALSLGRAPLASGLDPHPGLATLPPWALPHHDDARLDFGPVRPHIHPTGNVGLGLGEKASESWTPRSQ